jgi:Tfp pilus assembly protein PilF
MRTSLQLCALLATLGPLLGSCSEGEAPEQDVHARSTAPEVVAERAFERAESPEARALRVSLDLGDFDNAKRLLKAHSAELGIEALLLEARLAALSGEDLEVLRLVEEARAAAPSDPRVYATAAELSAAAGRLETARSELQRGVEAAGLTPELLRAQGVLELCRQGGASRGLALIERACQYDPELPFSSRARAQAHLLLAKSALSESRSRSALDEVKRSLELDPQDVDARLFFVDALAANHDFVNAAAVLVQLGEEGYGRQAELALMYKRAAMGELLEHRRDQALEYFRLAREAGLGREELGSGAQLLADAAMEAMLEGTHAFEAGDLETARLRFEHALHLDPELIVVHNYLAVVLFQQEEFLPAATHWREVLDTSIAEELELPEPVHIYLAKALFAADEKAAAREVLEAYLEREPEGEWLPQTEALLGEL